MDNKKTNYRWILAVFAMLLTFMSYMDRVNLSVATPAIIQELNFTKTDIGFIQTIFFLCYALMQIPAGTISEWLGHRKVLPFAISWWSIFTALSAGCTTLWQWLIVRGLFGLGEAPIFPGINSAFSNWFPKQERGKAVGFMLMGSHSGPVIGLPLSVFIMALFGWKSIFYIFGAIGLLVGLGYYVLIRNDPRESPFVNDEEARYIEEGRGFEKSNKKEMPPWKDFFKSVQFWAIGAQLGVANYISYVFVTWLPTYLIEARNFSIKEMGFAAALPSLGMILGNWACGIISDKLVKKGVSRSKIRTSFATVGLLFCCIGLYFTAIAIDKWTTVIWLTLALAFLGATMNTAWTSCTDLGGKFSGTISGWMNFCGNFIGAAAPTVTAWVVIQYGWNSAILATSVVGILGIVAWQFVKPGVPLHHAKFEK